jgi:WD40 repeat protein
MSRYSVGFVVLGFFLGGAHIVHAQELTRLEGHEGRIACLAFSPDGRFLASGATGQSDHGVKLWDMGSGKNVGTFNPDARGAAFSVAFAPDGHSLVVGDLGLSLRIISIPECKETAAWPTSKAQGREANRVAYSPDGQLVAAGLIDGSILVYQVSTGKVIRKLNHDQAITALAFSPRGTTLVSGTAYGLRIWDVASGSVIARRDEQSSGKFEVKTVAFTPDGKTLVVGDAPGWVRIIDAANGKDLRTFAMPRISRETVVDAIVVSPEGRIAYCAGRLPHSRRTERLYGGVVALDIATGKPLGLVKASYFVREEIGQLAISPDGKRLAAATGDRTIYLLDASVVVTPDELPR